MKRCTPYTIFHTCHINFRSKYCISVIFTFAQRITEFYVCFEEYFSLKWFINDRKCVLTFYAFTFREPIKYKSIQYKVLWNIFVCDGITVKTFYSRCCEFRRHLKCFWFTHLSNQTFEKWSSCSHVSLIMFIDRITFKSLER